MNAPIESEMLPIYLPDLEGGAQLSEIGQDTQKPVLSAFYAQMGAMWQTVEDAAFDVTEGLLFDTATGIALDRWGAIVGQPRLDMVDADYRRMIAARILINHCDGSPDAIAAIVRVIAGTDRAWVLTPRGGLYVVCFESQSMTPGLQRALVRAIQDTRMVGRWVYLTQGSQTGLVLADMPAGTPMESGVAGVTPVPAGYESRLDIGTLGEELL